MDFKGLFDWTYAGVDYSLDGNGGPECIAFIPTWQKIVETSLISTLAMLEIIYGIKKVSLPTKKVSAKHHYSAAKTIMLVMHCLVFGIELGFKFASRQMIWILNPCHLITMVQIFLLAAPPSKFVTAIFRLQMHSLTGAMIAILLPVLNTRLLPFEQANYFIQHGLMMVVPYFLLSQGGVFTTEATLDFSWAILAHGILYLWHWTVMQGLAIGTHVNLNNMVCPALSDPFYGRGYRIAAAIHQTFCILLFGKLHTFLAKTFCPKPPVEEEVGELARSGSMIESNGHAKFH